MLHLRRFIWYLAGRLILLCVIGGIFVCGFFMCLNTANIYIILQDGMEQRVEVVLKREDINGLEFFFHTDFLSEDPVIAGVTEGLSVYNDYTITGYEYSLEIERIWAWPWDDYATATVVERVNSLKGTPIASRRSSVSSSIPSWQGGRYNITLVREDSKWKIRGMQQKTIMMESVNSAPAS